MQYEGNIIELGVFRGNSIRMIAKTLKNSNFLKTIYACDSYEGFPKDRITKEDVSFFRSIFRLKNKFKYAEDIPAHLENYF